VVILLLGLNKTKNLATAVDCRRSRTLHSAKLCYAGKAVQSKALRRLRFVKILPLMEGNTEKNIFI
jgi:hypothetical protein